MVLGRGGGPPRPAISMLDMSNICLGVVQPFCPLAAISLFLQHWIGGAGGGPACRRTKVKPSPTTSPTGASFCPSTVLPCSSSPLPLSLFLFFLPFSFPSSSPSFGTVPLASWLRGGRPSLHTTHTFSSLFPPHAFSFSPATAHAGRPATHIASPLRADRPGQHCKQGSRQRGRGAPPPRPAM